MSSTPRIGLRLADYNQIYGIPTVRRSTPLLLKSRTKQRYFNPIQSELEHMTVVARVLKSENSLAHDLLQQRLPGIDLRKEQRKLKNTQSDSLVLEMLKKHSKTESDLDAWIACARSRSLRGALEIMDGRPWPTFLLLHTFNRPVTTRTEAWRLFQLYQKHISSVGVQYQLELCWLALDVAQHRLIEYLVPIVRLFLKYKCPEIDAALAGNEILWKLARYGTQWAPADLEVIKAAQHQVVQAYGNTILDKKGYTALAYVAHFESRPLAVQIINGSPPPPPNSTDLPYAYGTELILLNSCESFEQGLATLNAISSKKRKSAVWEAFLQGLVSGGFLDNEEEMIIRLYRYWKNNGIRPSSIMIGIVIRKLSSFKARREILDEFLALPNIKLTPSLFACLMAPVDSQQDYEHVKQYLYQMGNAHSHMQRVLESFLAMQARWEPKEAWATYQSIEQVGDPSSAAVAGLCQAASNFGMDWDGLDSTQRAVGEVKRYIQQEPSENFKSYPTEALVHAYIVMLGRANYQFELDNVMTWLHTIRFKPTKRILSAMIVYSQYGYTMQKLAPQSQEWPTEREVEVYARGER